MITSQDRDISSISVPLNTQDHPRNLNVSVDPPQTNYTTSTQRRRPTGLEMNSESNLYRCWRPEGLSFWTPAPWGWKVRRVNSFGWKEGVNALYKYFFKGVRSLHAWNVYSVEHRLCVQGESSRSDSIMTKSLQTWTPETRLFYASKWLHVEKDCKMKAKMGPFFWPHDNLCERQRIFPCMDTDGHYPVHTPQFPCWSWVLLLEATPIS